MPSNLSFLPPENAFKRNVTTGNASELTIDASRALYLRHSPQLKKNVRVGARTEHYGLLYFLHFFDLRFDCGGSRTGDAAGQPQLEFFDGDAAFWGVVGQRGT